MKKILFISMAIISFFLFSAEKISASLFVPVGSYEKLYKVKDLPQEEKYQTKEGQQLALGIKYTVYQICWIPIYQQGVPEFVGYIDENNYLPLNETILTAITEENNIQNISQLAGLPFWDAWGGKITAFFILILLVGNLFYKKEPQRKYATA